MKFGNASWGFRKTPLEEQLKITQNMGLDMLELGIANASNDIPLEASDEELEGVCFLFEEYGIKLICAATGNDFSTGETEDITKIKKVIDICEKLGVEYLRIFAGFSPVSEVVGDRWNTMIACLREVGEYSKGRVTLVIETHGGVKSYDDGVEYVHSTTTIVETLERMLAEIPRNVMFLFDPANLWAVGYEELGKLLRVLKGRIAVIHLKDFITVKSGHLLPAACGESQMNWEKLMKQLTAFDVPALFEYENTADVAEGCERCYHFIKREWVK